MDEPISGRKLASLIGEDLAKDLGVAEGEYSAAQVDALTDRLEESAGVADAVADGDDAALAELFSEDFVRERTAYDTFDGFDADAPWDESDRAALFAPRESGLSSSTSRGDADEFVAQNSEFTSTGEMVRAAVVDRVSGVLDGT